MGRFVPVTVSVVSEKRAPKFTGAKSYYDGKQCWQYKVVYDRPGTYNFDVPAGIACVRTVIVGGGGKPVCTIGSCCGHGGAGGGYSERCMTVAAGNQITVVVGRQSQDSTVACNSVAVHTAGGAVGCAPGAATGGQWNSRGGCSGFACNYCGGSVSHCTACIFFTTTTCCGYCLVFGRNPGTAGDSGTGCTTMALPGGASAGSPYYCCGGCSPTVCAFGSIAHGSVASGGGGVGSQTVPFSVWHYSCCDCVCPNYQSSACQFWRTGYPGSASGGGGSHGSLPGQCRSWEGICQSHDWQGGQGGPGGPDTDKNDPLANQWRMTYPCGAWRMHWCTKTKDPERKPWWDIACISGAGAPGFVNHNNYIFCCSSTHSPGFIGRPSNAGEGAGTGGWTSYCCDSCIFGDMYPYYETGSPAQGINWTLVCCLGQTADPFRCDAAYTLKDKLVGNFITCAGTLGGSGGVGICNFSSKAGAGGGGGTAKCHIVCICHGGSFNNCNGGGTPLAFPPCILDNLVSNAGSGLAIIYYKEA